MGKSSFLFELAQAQETCRIFEFFVFDELADQFPAWIVIFGVLFRRLIHPRQQCPAFQVHQVRGHDDKLGREIDIEQLEGVDVVQILAGDSLDGNRMNVHLVFLNEVKQQVQGAFENFKADFVVIGFHGGGS